MDIPLIVRVWLEGVTNPGEIDAEVYCVNHTGQPFQVSARSDSFTTVDEEAGTAAHHGSRPVEVLILPGEAKLVADVAGWEWDGAVGMELRFRAAGDTTGLRVGYNLRMPAETFTIEALGKIGHVILPSYTVLDGAGASLGKARRLKSAGLERIPLLEKLLGWLRSAGG